MKALRVIIFLSFVCFLSKTTIAQPASHESRTTYECMTMDCTNEVACGEITQTLLITGNTYMDTFEGTLIGEVSGTVYTFKESDHERSIPNKNNDNWVRGKSLTLHVFADGKLIAKIHYLNFIVTNAKGEITEWKQTPFITECL